MRAALLRRRWPADWAAAELSLISDGVTYPQHLQKPHTIRDESRSLLYYRVHARAAQPCRWLVLTVYKLAAAQVKPARPPQQLCVRLSIVTARQVLLARVSVDESSTVLEVKRRLEAGQAEGRWRHYLCGVAAAEQELVLQADVREKLLYDQQPLAWYGLHNSPHHFMTHRLLWQRRRLQQQPSSSIRLLEMRRAHRLKGTVEICIELLSPAPALSVAEEDEDDDDDEATSQEQLSAARLRREQRTRSKRRLLLDVQLQWTVKELKLRVGRLHPAYTVSLHPLPASNQHLFFPSRSDAAAAREDEGDEKAAKRQRAEECEQQSELPDARRLSELGVKAGDVLGLRWEATEHEKQQELLELRRRERLQKKNAERRAKLRLQREAQALAEAAAAASASFSPPRPPPLPAAADDGEEEDVWVSGWKDMGDYSVREEAQRPLHSVSVCVVFPRQEVRFAALPCSTTVADVKARLAERKCPARGLPASQQRLSLDVEDRQDAVFSDGRLRDERRLDFYFSESDRDGEPLELIWAREGEAKEQEGAEGGESREQRQRQQELELRLTFIDSESADFLIQQRCLVVMQPDETVEDLKAAIECRVPALVFASTPPLTRVLPLSAPPPPALADDWTLQQCGLRDGSDVWVDAQVQVIVRLQPANARTTLYVVRRLTSIAELKQRIALLPGAPPAERQCVRAFPLTRDGYGDARLATLVSSRAVDVVDGLSLSQYWTMGQLHEGLLLLVFPTLSPRQPQDDRRDVRTIRARADRAAAAGLSAADSTLADPELIRLRVKTDGNDEFELAALRSEPIRCIKYRLAALTGLQPREQLLFLSPAERLRDDGKTLDECGVQDGQQLLLSLADLVLPVLLPGRRLLHLSVSVGDTVAQLKAAIAQRLRLKAEHAAMEAETKDEIDAAEQASRAVESPAQLHFRFSSMLRCPVADDSTLRELGFVRPDVPRVIGSQPKIVKERLWRRDDALRSSGPITCWAVLRQTPRAQRGAADLQEQRAGDDEAVRVCLQLGSNPTLHPFLLFRHESLAELRRFLCSLFPQQNRWLVALERRVLLPVPEVRLSVSGLSWREQGCVRDEFAAQGDTLLVEPVWPLPGELGYTAEAAAGAEQKDDDEAAVEEKTEEQPEEEEKEAHEMEEEKHQEEKEKDKEEEGGGRSGLDWHTSSSYAWLPAEFDVSESGAVSCLSCINGLHPIRHAALYPTVCEVLAAFLPLFEAVLTELRHPRPPRVPVGSWYMDDDLVSSRLQLERDERMHRDGDGDGDGNSEVQREEREDEDEDGDEEEEEEEDEDEDEEMESGQEDDDNDDEEEEDEDGEWEYRPPVVQPEALLPFVPPPPPPSVVSLRGRRLQVIVKLCNIELTPACPTYGGGVWHVEGMRNECIVSSGIAYYAQENIGPSQLAFRSAVCEPQYEQGDNRGVAAVFGLRDDEPLLQPGGSVHTRGGRCIAFPNILQHQVQPFSLRDRTRPGHRKILVFFLVDPTQRITSTATVPPQQADWTTQERREAMRPALPVAELQQLVQQYVDWPMALDEARKHRAGLMKERKYYTRENTTQMFERPFSFCEH